MKRIAWLAAFVGGLVDMILSNIFSMPVAVAVVMSGGLTHVPAGQVTTAYLAALHGNPLLYGAALFGGCLASVLAGVVAGLMAKHDRVLNGALSSWACVGLSVFALTSHMQTASVLVDLLLLPVSPALGALGGLLVLRFRRPAASIVAP